MNQMNSVGHPRFWSAILDDIFRIAHVGEFTRLQRTGVPMPAQQPSPNSKLPKALVTGATSGIGRAVALQLAQDGFNVMVHGRDAARGAQTVKEITDKGGQASFVVADFNSPAEIQRLAKDIGEIDVLVNNAGFAAWGPTAELDIAT